MNHRELLEPRRILNCLSCCPNEVATYAANNMNTIHKILNHLLVLMLVCNVFLFFSSWSITFAPAMGFSTVFVSFLLSLQTFSVFLTVNNHRITSLAFLEPTEFMIGVSLGICIGGCLLALVVSSAFGSVARCDVTAVAVDANATQPLSDPVYETACQESKSSMNHIWFWSGFIFWLNLACSLLIAIGRHELSQQGTPPQVAYENIGTSDEPFQDQFARNQRYQQSGGGGGNNMFAGGLHTPTSSYAGDYSTPPEIRSGQQASIDEKARITSV